MIKFRATLRRRWHLLILATLIGVLGGVASSWNAPAQNRPVYDVEQLVVANRGSSTDINIQQDSLRVTRGAVPVAAAAKLGRSDVDELAADVSGTASDETSTISISISAEEIGPAKKVVAAFVAAFLEIANSDLQKDQARRLKELQARSDQIVAQLAEFDQIYPQAASPESLSSPDLRIRALATQRQTIVQSQSAADQDLLQLRLNTSQELPYSALGEPTARLAKTSLLNVPTSPLIRAGLLGFIGLLFGVALVLVVERSNQRIDTREELADAIGLPIIAEIGLLPKSKRSTHSDGRLRLEGVWAEPYRRVRAAIQFVQSNAPTTDADRVGSVPRVFLVTSAQPGEGKSTSAALTALALAEIDVPTVVIGADFRRPQVEALLGYEPGPTIQDLAQLAIDRPTPDDVVRATRHPNLYLASGGPSTREVAQLVIATKDLVNECTRRGATVIIDSSPLQAANDTVDLLEIVDEVILVVRSGDSSAAGLIDSVQLLTQLGASVMGVILVGTPGVGRMQIYYDGYYTHPTAPPPEAKA